MAAIKEIGCICTLLLHRQTVPCDVHHLTDGGRRKGHQYTKMDCMDMIEHIYRVGAEAGYVFEYDE